LLAEGVRLYHVRHGQTDWNAEGRLQGQTDIPLNAVGRAQAARNGAALAAHFAETGIAAGSLRYVASPLGRAQATMRIVRTGLGLGADPFDTEPALIEVDFGDWSGFTTEELKQRGQGALVRARRADKWGFVPPGGESYAALSQRVAAWLETVRADTVVVSHGGVFRVLWGLICGVPAREVPLLPATQDAAVLFLDGRFDYI
jgi:probable phosphoglycerate mutase